MQLLFLYIRNNYVKVRARIFLLMRNICRQLEAAAQRMRHLSVSAADAMLAPAPSRPGCWASRVVGRRRHQLAGRQALLVGALRFRVASRKPRGGLAPGAVLDRSKPAQGTNPGHEFFAVPSDGDAYIYTSRNAI